MEHKLIDIVKLWETETLPQDIQKEVANHRASICDSCDKLRYNEQNKFYFCGGCGCPLGNKIFNPHLEGVCPLNKFNK